MASTDKVKNVAQKTKGKIKEQTGKLTGNSKLERHGNIDQVKANAKQVGEKLKDALKK
jgi:uncharacterized protein YjbJ (UPF0337 family)